jgi:hypothetical protein
MFGWLHDVNTKSPLPSRLKLVIAIIVGGLLLLQLLHYVLATPEPSTPEPPMPDENSAPIPGSTNLITLCLVRALSDQAL